MALPENLTKQIEAVRLLEQEVIEARSALRHALHEHYGLLGRFVTDDRGHRFRIAGVAYTSGGRVSKVSGPKVKKDGTLSQVNGYVYADYSTGEVKGLEPL
jgi:hypothetical protein